jgi:hypothetical protein
MLEPRSSPEREAGKKIAAEPFKTEIRRDDALLRRTSIRFLLGRADQTRAFAEEVNDPEVKRLLLKLAESYEQIAEQAGAATAKAEDLLSAAL